MTKEPDAPPPAPRRRPAARRALRADGGRLRDHLRLDARVPLRARHDLHHRRLFVLLHDRARPRAVVARGGARRLCRRRVRRRARPLRLPPDPTRRGLILYGVRRLVRHWRGGRESRHHFLRRELRVDLDAADARERYRRRRRDLVARDCFDAGRASAVRLSQLVPRAHRRRRRAARALGEPRTGAWLRPQPAKTLAIRLRDRLPAGRARRRGRDLRPPPGWVAPPPTRETSRNPPSRSARCWSCRPRWSRPASPASPRPPATVSCSSRSPPASSAASAHCVAPASAASSSVSPRASRCGSSPPAGARRSRSSSCSASSSRGPPGCSARGRGCEMVGYILNLLLLVSISGILAGSLNFIIGYAGIYSMAHAAFFGIAAYSGALIAMHVSTSLLVAIPVVMALCAILSLVISLPSLRVRGEYFVVASLGLQMIAFTVFSEWREVTGGLGGITGVPVATLFGVRLRSLESFLAVSLVCLAFVTLVIYVLARTSFGRNLKAIRDNEVAAAAKAAEKKPE